MYFSTVVSIIIHVLFFLFLLLLAHCAISLHSRFCGDSNKIQSKNKKQMDTKMKIIKIYNLFYKPIDIKIITVMPIHYI